MVRNALWLPILAAALLLNPKPAGAQQLTYYSTAADYNAAVANAIPTIDFEDLPAGTFSTTLVKNGVNFSSPGGLDALLALSPDQLPALSSTALLANYKGSPMIMDFPQGTSAVSLQAMVFSGGLSPEGSSVVVTVEGTNGFTSQSTVPLSAGTSTFMGFSLDSGSITRVTVANPPSTVNFVLVDDVSAGSLPVASDPLSGGLDAIGAALAKGRETGAIRRLGTSLEDKLAAAEAAYEAGDEAGVADALKSLGNQVRAQRGKKIAAATADELLQLISDTLALL